MNFWLVSIRLKWHQKDRTGKADIPVSHRADTSTPLCTVVIVVVVVVPSLTPLK